MQEICSKKQSCRKIEINNADENNEHIQNKFNTRKVKIFV